MVERYAEIKQIYDDIKNLNIQGATNVAISTLEGMKKYVEISQEKDKYLFYKELIEIGEDLALVRDNEPLARNGVTFIKYSFGQHLSDLQDLSTMKQVLDNLCDEYLDIIEQSKKQIIEKSVGFLDNFTKVFTHCHSSTATSLIIAMSKAKSNFKAVCTETRPLYQGRITAQELVEAGIDTTLIVDSAKELFIVGRGSIPVEIVFIGADMITERGHAINKIGSWSLAMAAEYADKPLYVVTPSLKMAPLAYIHDVKIEMRESSELWEDAPEGLHMYNPAFEIIDSKFITGYITEFGITKPNDIEKEVSARYPWITYK